MKNNLRVLMAENKINMSELAEATGIARSTISKFYNENSKRIDLGTITTLCNYFNCSIDELIVLEQTQSAK